MTGISGGSHLMISAKKRYRKKTVKTVNPDFLCDLSSSFSTKCKQQSELILDPQWNKYPRYWKPFLWANNPRKCWVAILMWLQRLGILRCQKRQRAWKASDSIFLPEWTGLPTNQSYPKCRYYFYALVDCEILVFHY